MSLAATLPKDVSLKDDFNYKVTGGDAVDIAGNSYSCNLIISTVPTPGVDTLKVSWAFVEITFLFVLTPDVSGTQLTTDPSFTMTYAEWVQLLVSEFKANYKINEAFIVDYYLGEIRFTSRTKGTDYVITFTATGFTWNSTVLVVAVNEVLHDLYKISCEVLDEADTKIGEDLLPITDSGEALFNVGEYASGSLSSDFTKEKDVGASLIKEDKSICKPFQIKYSEYYGNPPVHKLVNIAALKYMISGGVSKWQKAIWNENAYSFFNWLKDEKKFLTFRPRGAKVAYLSSERLYYLNTDNSISIIDMYANAYWNDGSATLDQHITSVFVTRDYSVYELICTPEKIRDNFTSVPTSKELVKFEVYLKKNSTGALISEIFDFIIDSSYYNNNRFFIFKNSLSVWDTIRTTGEVIKDANYSSELFSRFLDEDFNTSLHENERTRGEEVLSYKVDSGVIYNRETANYYRELFFSEKIYEIILGKIIPVRLVSQKARIYKDNDYNYHIVFEVEYAYTNKYYSNIQELINAEGDYFGDGFGDGFYTAESYQGDLQQNSNEFN